jgi:hypothetical protein
MVCVVDLALGLEFLKEIHNHYEYKGEKEAKMSLEKLQLLV